MYLAKLQTRGFRALDNFSIEFEPGLNVIVGPNNAGKTAILEAISLVLSVFSPLRDIYPQPEDFWHSPDGQEKEDLRFEIILDLRDVPDPNPFYVNWMVKNENPRTARIALVCTKMGEDKIKPVCQVGFPSPSTPSEESLERLRPIFLPPLRDAKNALKPGRNSRLARLVQQIAKSDATRIADVQNRFKKLQDDLVKGLPFSEAIQRVNKRLSDATGERYKQIASLGFVDPEFKKITEALEMKVGLDGMLSFALSENGLGYNNLIYVATILSQLGEDSEQDLRLLLIEEPEAHLHPQMQQVLADALIEASKKDQRQGVKQSQVIVTSHSPLLASHFPVDKITVLHSHKTELAKPPKGITRPQKGKPLARNIRDFGLNHDTISDLSRYLDSTKANLFFSEGVILVEGIAEALLLPVFANAINRPLSEYHVSIVNIDGLAFDPFLQLFNELTRLQIPCALLTDSDPYFQDGDPYCRKKKQNGKTLYDESIEDETAGDEILFPTTIISYGRAYKLEQLAIAGNSGAKVFRNLKTLEYDLALTDFLDHMLSAYKSIHPKVGAEIENTLVSESDKRKKALRFFKMFSTEEKGVFAQRLAHNLDLLVRKHIDSQKITKGNNRADWDIYLSPPNYICDAIKWVTGDCDWSLFKLP